MVVKACKFRRRIEARTIFIVGVITVTNDPATIHSDQFCKQLQHCLFLRGRARIARTTDIRNGDAMGIMTPCVTSRLADGPLSDDITIWHHQIVIPGFIVSMGVMYDDTVYDSHKTVV